jgi:hypothetical protein
MAGYFLYKSTFWFILKFNTLRLCEGGELFDYIIERQNLSEKEAAQITK